MKKTSPRKTNESPPCQRKQDLWKGCLEIKIGDGAIVQIDGIGSESNALYGRMVPCRGTNNSTESVSQLTIGTVVDALVGECWKRVAKDILERQKKIEKDSYPSAQTLLKLGAVWLLNETEYVNGGKAQAHRCTEQEENTVPNWEDFSLRVHYAPGRFFSAYEVDWGKYCRGLLIDGSVEAAISGETPHLGSQGLPDDKDGVIVYENPQLGYAVINKPGPLPLYPTIENQVEDAFTMFTEAHLERRKNDLNDPHRHSSKYASIPLRGGMDTEMSGLLPIAIKRSFCNYMKKLIGHTDQQQLTNKQDPYFIKKIYSCLVCIKNSNALDQLEKWQKNKTVITHYCSKSATTKRYFQNKPDNGNQRGSPEYMECQLRITNMGFSYGNRKDADNKNKTSNQVQQQKMLRAARVSSKYVDQQSLSPTLAKSLWGSSLANAAKDAQYVTELQVEVLGKHYPHQIRGQLAALGYPIVGDAKNGGGVCEYYSNRHRWKRLAIQCSELSFMEPEWGYAEEKQEQLKSSLNQRPVEKTTATKSGEDTTITKRRVYIPSDRRAHFKLNTTWWSEYVARHSEIQ